MKNILDRIFHLTERKTNTKTELLAGITTFSTMAYIIVVNPDILRETGMDPGAVMIATILASFLATMCMGMYANYPFALAPSMGLNAYFTYGIVLGEGHSWQAALGVCFWAGIAFLILNVFGIRQMIMDAIPDSLRFATAGGIGIFLAFIGLKNIQLVVPNETTIVAIGNTSTPQIALAGLGVIFIVAMMRWRIRGAMMISIIIIWALGLTLGLVKWQGIFDIPPSLTPTLWQFDPLVILKPDFIPIIFSFIFVAIFDTAGALIGLAEQGEFIDQKGKIPRANRALINDAIGTIAGSAMGTSSLTTYLESASGIAAGGRTGLTAVVVAILFLVSLFFAPFATSIPHFATSPVLIVIGSLMLKQVTRLPWKDPTEYVPAFIILITIPLTFSVATGLGLGFITYPLIKSLTGKGRDVHWFVWVMALIFALKFGLD